MTAMAPENQPQDSPRDQKAHWNGRAGRAWAEIHDLLETLFQPLATVLLDEAPAKGRVLDVGCGAGGTTLGLARLLGEGGEAIGIDVSAPLVATAQGRAARAGLAARFLQADAQTHAFAPGHFDAVVSRFGVMFFDDPVWAFTNLRQATRPDGTLRVIAWRGPAENPFMTTAERAAAPLLPYLPPRDPDAPGQFAFADQDRVHRILQEGGWRAIDIAPIDTPCTLTENDLLRYLTHLGPVGMALAEADQPTRERVIETIQPAFALFMREGIARFTAACWLIQAHAP